MNFIQNITDIRTIQWLVCNGSCILAFLLLIIKLPKTEYSRNLANSKNFIAISFLICGFLMAFTLYCHEKVEDYEMLSAITMLVAVSYSSTVMSFSIISLMDNKHSNGTFIAMNLFPISVVAVILVEAYISGDSTVYRICLAAFVILFIAQSIYYIIEFDKVYKRSVKALEAYYDDDEEHRLKWIRFCYILTMLVDMFILVYLILPHGFMRLYLAWYMLYLLYFTSNFISFIGSHKIVMDAFAHKTLTGQDLFPAKKGRKSGRNGSKAIEKELQDLESNIERWIKEKKYRDTDKSREDVVRELKTTKETMQLYFSEKGIDFRSWRTELRIEDAKVLLLENRKASVNAIGELAGFSDRSNFHTLFSKIVGCSPKQWRECNGHLDQ